MKNYILKNHLHLQSKKQKENILINNTILGTRKEFKILDPNLIKFKTTKIEKIITNTLAKKGRILIMTNSRSSSFSNNKFVKLQFNIKPGYLSNNPKFIPDIIVNYDHNINSSKLNFINLESLKLNIPFIYISNTTYNPNKISYHINLNSTAPKIKNFITKIIYKALINSQVQAKMKFKI